MPSTENYMSRKIQRGKNTSHLNGECIVKNLSKQTIAREKPMHILLAVAKERDLKYLKELYPNSEFRVSSNKTFPEDFGWADHVGIVSKDFHTYVNLNADGKIVGADFLKDASVRSKIGREYKKVSILKINK